MITKGVLSMPTKSYTLRNIYILYEDYIKSEGITQAVDYKTFRQICEDYFAYIVDRVIDKALDFKMPYNLGTLSVGKYKPTKINKHYIDFNATKKEGKTIYMHNSHTNGWKYRFYWYGAAKEIKNVDKYKLSWVRTEKRRLAKLIKSGKDYIPKEYLK